MNEAKRHPEGSVPCDVPGVNVIGHVSANLGLGVVARNVIGLAQSLGRDVRVFDVPAGASRSGVDSTYAANTVAVLADLPHAINIYVLSLAGIASVLKACPPDFFSGSRLNAMLCFWELPVLPAWGVTALQPMDVVLAATDFMEAAYRQSVTGTWVVPARIPVTPPPSPVPWDRSQLGIPGNGVVFVCGFEPASDPNRKNPFAVVEAFLRGVGESSRAHLVIRVNNAYTRHGTLDGVVVKLLALAGTHPRIKVLTEPMSYAEVVGLYRDADVYVSLHRAEGLGLGMAEAMLMARPVIATGWSGNMSFMSHANSCLVGYRQIPVASTLDTYRLQRHGAVATWADARVDEAAALMRLLLDDASLRERIGRRAYAAMHEYNDHAARGGFFDELDAILEIRRALADVGYARNASRPAYASVRLSPPTPLRAAWWRLASMLRRS